MSARRTSPMGMTPSFSPSMGSANREKASRISASSSAVMSFSFASFERRALDLDVGLEAAPAAGGRRLGGCYEGVSGIHQVKLNYSIYHDNLAISISRRWFGKLIRS